MATSNTTTMSDAGNVRSNGDHVSMLLSALLGGHSGLTTVVALLTTERSSCQRCLIHSSGVSLSPTVASLLTTESVRRASVAAGVLQWSHDLLGVRSFAGSCFSINDGERDMQLYC